MTRTRVRWFLAGGVVLYVVPTALTTWWFNGWFVPRMAGED